MSRSFLSVAARVVAGGVLGASAGAGGLVAQNQPAVQADPGAIARAKADSARYPYTAADIRFMSGMISHHAPAIVMARWAPSHNAGASVQRLAERIINAQQDEIRLMQHWLADRNQPVPEPGPDGVVRSHAGHEMLMPGMLIREQMRELDQAKGKEFDRLFLTFMIQHHRGAVVMVTELFETEGAGRDLTAFKLATDISVDQTTEIRRMQRMLADLFFTEGTRP